jgi:hypothetical protein
MSRFVLSLAFAASASAATCPEYTNCKDCLNPNDPALDCGWCSPDPATSATGQKLTQCMDHTSKGWYCSHLYMHDGCIPGYICNHVTGQCQLTEPGQGDTKEHCELTCTAHPQPNVTSYSCNATTFKCEAVPSAGHDNSTCTGSCTNSTPSALVGLWRGLDVQQNFTIGEWEMNFTEKEVTWGPHATPTMYKATVSSTSPQEVRLVMTAPASMAGGVRFVSYATPGWPTGPETNAMALAIQRPSSHQTPPADVSSAMGDANFDVYVFNKCNSWKSTCDFTPAFTAAAREAMQRRALEAAAERAAFVDMLKNVGKARSDDACTVHSACDSCINDPLKVCGWCDGIITFGDNTTCGEDGNGCCGGASAFSKCTSSKGSYWKTCPVVCDRTDYTNPFCRPAKNKELNQSSIQKFADCDLVDTWHACVFGQYCNATAKQCAYVHSKAECEKIEGCDPDHPTCTNCTAPPPKSYIFCHPDEGCATAANKSDCIANPFCDVNNTGCNPTTCKASTYWSCDTGYQCQTHTGPKPAKYFNTSDDCKKTCYDHDVDGVWRGLRIDDGFVVEEWDFQFTEASAGATVSYVSRKTNESFHGTYEIGDALTVEGYGSFSLTITLSTGEILTGLYSVEPDKATGPITRFMYLGLPLKTGDTAATYDDAMATTKQEFTLMACGHGIPYCDFSKAAPSVRR